MGKHEQVPSAAQARREKIENAREQAAAWDDAHEENTLYDQQKAWESELYADAGETDLSNEAMQRIDEAEAYEAHMKAMHERDNFEPASEEGAKARRTAFIDKLDDLNSEPVRDDQGQVEAHALNDALDAANGAALENRKQEIRDAIANTPALRRLDLIAADIRNLRETGADESKISKRLDAFYELAQRYEESAEDGYDPDVMAELLRRAEYNDEEFTPDVDKKSNSEIVADMLNQAGGDAEADIEDDKDADNSSSSNEKDDTTTPGKEVVLYNKEVADVNENGGLPVIPEGLNNKIDEKAPDLDAEDQPHIDEKAPDLDGEAEPHIDEKAPDLEEDTTRKKFWERMRGEKGSKERSRFRKVVAGIGIVAAATAAAVVMHKTGTLPTVNGVRDWFEGTFGSNGDVPQAELPDGGVAPEAPNPSEVPGVDGNDFGGTNPVELPGGNIDAARNVTAGEGWYQTLQEIGFSKEEMT